MSFESPISLPYLSIYSVCLFFKALYIDCFYATFSSNIIHVLRLL